MGLAPTGAFHGSWVIVRRVGMGRTPFQWEIHKVGRDEQPVKSSEERFRTMTEAYEAGTKALAAIYADLAGV